MMGAIMNKPVIVNSEFVGTIFNHATFAMPDPVRIPDARGKGGYLCVASLDGYILGILGLGKISKLKADKYFGLCQEKAKRLAANPDHLSSWQTRDESKNQFGGAIRTNYVILSFSGFPELLDEAYVLHLAGHCRYKMRVEFLAEDNHVKILQLNNNSYVTGWYGYYDHRKSPGDYLWVL